jgi:hypothetical protein
MAAVAATNTTGNIIPGSLPAQLFLPVIFQKKKRNQFKFVQYYICFAILAHYFNDVAQ